MQHNILNQIFKTLRHKEHVILSSSMDEKIYLQGFLEEVLKAIKGYNLKRYPHGLWMVGSLIRNSSPREIQKK